MRYLNTGGGPGERWGFKRVMWLFLTVAWVVLYYVSVVFPDIGLYGGRSRALPFELTIKKLTQNENYHLTTFEKYIGTFN